MIIVSGADDRFAMPLAVTLYSALANLNRGRTVSLYIMDGGISEENRRRLTQVLNVNHVEVHIEWVKPDLSRLSGVKTTQWFRQATYLRLLIPELVPKQFDRVIYLDSDLVVEEDLGQLWEEEISDFPALAVQGYVNPYVSCPGALPDTYQLLGLSPDTPYCNAGVMVMNLKRWRTEEIGRRALEYTHKFHRFIRSADQDGINAIIAGAWGLLDPKWNVMPSVISSYGRFYKMSEVEMQHAQGELLRAPFILHFAGLIKPWHFTYRGLARSRFFYYLEKSGWFGSIGDMRSLMEEAWKEQKKYDKWMERSYIARQELHALRVWLKSLLPGNKMG
jgi:lipopolysaccharide biosynthesis glycosyltransferase